ncbi:MAG: hypothetical protein M1822_000399 [Bathelium mastoideum]|nr:MAG: hypothetical protein M1822_000399 [Bathelium mastoideum]
MSERFVLGGALNSLQSNYQLTTPQTETVVKPNEDTIYAEAIYDLSQQNVEIHVPVVDTDRYWNFALFDPYAQALSKPDRPKHHANISLRYGENYANIGSVTKKTPGTYLLRRAVDVNEPPGIQAPGGSCANTYNGCINSPTTDGTMLERILVRDNGSDLTYVQDLIHKSSVETVKRDYSCRDAAAEPLTNATFLGLPNNTVSATLELLARLAHRNPPIDTNITVFVNSQLRAAGISNGHYRKPRGVNLTQAYADFNASIAHYQEVGVEQLGNGWAKYVPQGLYGPNYIARANAVSYYLANTADQALYPQYEISEPDLSLSDSHAYMYTFSSKPPVESDGFWSVTMYNSSGFFVENSENKYEVGDRSNITYPDGQQVYGPNASTVIQPFQVLVQNATPPANWTAK